MWLSGLRRNVLWVTWGAKSYNDMVARAKQLPLMKRMHLWQFSLRRIEDLERNGLPAWITRLTKELCDLKKEPDESFDAGPIDSKDFSRWRCSLIGPKESPYEGGVFFVSFDFAVDYPFRPPKVRFVTKLFHPNVSQSGHICLDILYDAWSPALTVARVLLSLRSLMTDPNADDPMDPDIAQMYKVNRRRFDETARLWTKRFAM